MAVLDLSADGYAEATQPGKGVGATDPEHLRSWRSTRQTGRSCSAASQHLFDALARRPRGGFNYQAAGEAMPDPYVAIPSRCVTGDCGRFIRPEYEFVSSRRDIGDFVKQDPASSDDHAVLLGPDDQPISDSTSGLFCAYNPATTTVSVRAGGLVYSQQVTVEQGSVERPCGTVPWIDPPPEDVETPIDSDAPEPTPNDDPRGPNPTGGSFPVDIPPPAASTPPPSRAPAPAPTPKPAIPPVLPAAIIPPFLVQLPNNAFVPPVINPAGASSRAAEPAERHLARLGVR